MNNNWFKQIKEAVDASIPVIVTIGATVTAVATILQVKESSDEVKTAMSEHKELLRNIEEKIAVAIESPTIVKVEIGDDIELIGMGNRTD